MSGVNTRSQIRSIKFIKDYVPKPQHNIFLCLSVSFVHTHIYFVQKYLSIKCNYVCWNIVLNCVQLKLFRFDIDSLFFCILFHISSSFWFIFNTIFYYFIHLFENTKPKFINKPALSILDIVPIIFQVCLVVFMNV